MVIDTFLFFNELSILNMRLHELNDTVDYFVISESEVSHAGTPKPLYYRENKDLFSKFNHKIISLVVDEATTNDYISSKKGTRIKLTERAQRDFVSKGLDDLGLEEDDLILNSDVDEIINTKAFIENHPQDCQSYRFRMRYFLYNFNWEFKNTPWERATCSTYSHFKSTTANQLRNRGRTPVIANDGWQCSFFGDADAVATKLKNYSHSDEVTLVGDKEVLESSEEFTDRDRLKYCIEKGINIHSENQKRGSRVFTRQQRKNKDYNLQYNDGSLDNNLPKYKDLAYGTI